jgi:hypothetical protein
MAERYTRATTMAATERLKSLKTADKTRKNSGERITDPYVHATSGDFPRRVSATLPEECV